METAYVDWIGRPVILRVQAGSLHVPVRGRLILETPVSLRLCIAANWTANIFKSMIGGIEPDVSPSLWS